MKTLWITYAWIDNNDGDFDYIVQELKSLNLNCLYDKVALIPGKRIWEQIGEKILNPETDAWAYLVTKNSLNSEPCKEELAYALDKALNSKGNGFPIIGLVHNVPFAEIPIALKTRLCIDLKDPNWKEQIIAGVNSQQPEINPKTQDPYKISFHKLNGNTAIELRTRFEEKRYWRIAVPDNVVIKQSGTGVSGHYNVSGIKTSYFDANIELASIKCKMIGIGDAISSSTSGYLLVEGDIPDFVAFGFANGRWEMPVQWYQVKNN